MTPRWQHYSAITALSDAEVVRVVAEHHRFTDEEFDFILNYDIMYRLEADEVC